MLLATIRISNLNMLRIHLSTLKLKVWNTKFEFNFWIPKFWRANTVIDAIELWFLNLFNLKIPCLIPYLIISVAYVKIRYSNSSESNCLAITYSNLPSLKITCRRNRFSDGEGQHLEIHFLAFPSFSQKFLLINPFQVETLQLVTLRLVTLRLDTFELTALMIV